MKAFVVLALAALLLAPAVAASAQDEATAIPCHTWLECVEMWLDCLHHFLAQEPCYRGGVAPLA